VKEKTMEALVVILVIALIILVKHHKTSMYEKDRRVERLEGEKDGIYRSVDDVPEQLLEPDEWLERSYKEVQEGKAIREELTERSRRLRTMVTETIPPPLVSQYGPPTRSEPNKIIGNVATLRIV
jgi:hypothetical protein